MFLNLSTSCQMALWSTNISSVDSHNIKIYLRPTENVIITIYYYIMLHYDHLNEETRLISSVLQFLLNIYLILYIENSNITILGLLLQTQYNNFGIIAPNTMIYSFVVP